MSQDRKAASVLHGDWLALAPDLPAASIDLLYADPPFNTGATKRTPPGAAKRAGPAADDASYEDSWPDTASYIAWLAARLRATLPAMKPSASVLIHCDWRTCHHVRLLLDELLGADHFVNHLIWTYGLGGSSPRRFARKHDDILFYAINPETYWFEAPRINATSNRMMGQTKKATDVLDVPSLNNMAKERTGYPTQKPLALLDLLIGACCPPGGVVLDPCCGSGTTLVAAAALGRSAIGFDRSAAAVKLSRHRLSERPEISESSVPCPR